MKEAIASFGRETLAWEWMKNRLITAAHDALCTAVDGVSQLMKVAPEGSWAGLKAPDYLDLLDQCEPGIPITAAEYRENLQSIGPADSVGGDYVLCTARDARSLIDDLGPPRVPILVPPEWNISHGWFEGGTRNEPSDSDLFEKFFSWVKVLDQPMDVTNPFAQATDEFQLPEKMPPNDIEALFKRQVFDKAMGPINLLEIRSRDDNPVSPCLAELSDFKLMRDLRSLPDVTGADKVKAKAADLSWSFQICGQKGVFSEPHIDHHGVTTTITVQAGEKLWPIYSRNSAQALESWIEQHDEYILSQNKTGNGNGNRNRNGKDNGYTNGNTSDEDMQSQKGDGPENGNLDVQEEGRWTALYLRRGGLLIQPPGTLHAPYSPTNVLCSGTMHIDTRGLVKSAELSVLETKHPNITNEEPAMEYANCMIQAARMWRRMVVGLRWLPDEDRKRFLQLLQEYMDGLEPPACCVKPKRGAHDRSCKVPKLRKILLEEKATDNRTAR
ncbi:uncharacterized protein BCR38DRAFT_418977 [Pseudomassariella vexata]|uniref:JmjC domain-containing protein n=1 Tax=Pseudomassariella vexata TaxID=1141098 RepID=A0A1Y2ELH1_9PEZI|nr:uncharacterized protein BCR38DRAFT_418977 [Pseudomassariella vexata]ORY72126.1 hypothetical protein BCR38DRAFT_418977 [Pseudomassariella vexata]